MKYPVVKWISRFYFCLYNDLELDDVVYETVHITEFLDGSLREIRFEFSIDDLNELEKYVKDFVIAVAGGIFITKFLYEYMTHVIDNIVESKCDKSEVRKSGLNGSNAANEFT